MKLMKRRIGTSIISLGFNPRRLIASVRFLPTFFRQICTLYSQLPSVIADFPISFVPTLSDRYMPGGAAKGHYFHQDLWAARRIYKDQPNLHIDVGSRIDGFVAHLLTFRSVKVLDVRPVTSMVEGLSFEQMDLMAPLSIKLEADSVSCLHALEHFGLGRYGDPIDLDGWKKGIVNLASLMCSGGRLYLSVPIGEQCIEFNVQRIFSPTTIIDFAQTQRLKLVEFSYIDDAGDFHERKTPSEAVTEFGCGCYLFVKD
jgi:hypothetical protein